jgi:hypothetical protein
MVIAAALIAASAASVTPASAYVRHPYAAAHYAYRGGVAHPYAAYRVARGAAVGAVALGAAATGAYYGGYAQPNYSGDTYGYGTAGYYGGHVLGCGVGNWRCRAAAGGYAQPYYNSGDTYSYGSYGTGYTNAGFYAASPGYGFGTGGYYGGHVLGCGIGNRRCW